MKAHSNQTWVLSSVYASTVPGERQQNWQETRLVSEINEAHAVAGDFSYLFGAADKVGGR